jgi:hypothetical protein
MALELRETREQTHNRRRMMPDEHPILKELTDLLEKHGATLTAEDHWTGYAECGSDVRMTIDMPWPHKDIDLGGYFYPPDQLDSTD